MPERPLARGCSLASGRPQDSLEKRPQAASIGLKREIWLKNLDFGQKSWILAFFCPEMDGYWPNSSIYDLGGRYMASGRPRRSASSGLKRPQMTSNDLKCPQMSSNDLNIALVPVTKSLGKNR